MVDKKDFFSAYWIADDDKISFEKLIQQMPFSEAVCVQILTRLGITRAEIVEDYLTGPAISDDAYWVACLFFATIFQSEDFCVCDEDSGMLELDSSAGVGCPFAMFDDAGYLSKWIHNEVDNKEVLPKDVLRQMKDGWEMKIGPDLLSLRVARVSMIAKNYIILF